MTGDKFQNIGAEAQLVQLNQTLLSSQVFQSASQNQISLNAFPKEVLLHGGGGRLFSLFPFCVEILSALTQYFSGHRRSHK